MRWLLAVALLVGVTVAASSARAATLEVTRRKAIVWLTQNQNADGSWGVGQKRFTATSEALLALVKAGRGQTIAARRAQGWLQHSHTTAVDSTARAVRALTAAGLKPKRMTDRLVAAQVTKGWGATLSVTVDTATSCNSYDTALALAALNSAGIVTTQAAIVTSLRRQDWGWSGDGISWYAAMPDSWSDRTTTAEILRAIKGVVAEGSMTDTLAFVSSTPPAGAPATAATPSLEIAARLAARHAWGQTDTGLESQLLTDARLTNGVWSTADPLVNAIGLLALVTKPGGFLPQCAGDADCDGVADALDAFPDDPLESLDTDGDGIANGADPDRDGDGRLNGDDPLPLNPGEWADLDLDGIGDHQDLDDDGDGVQDLTEYQIGTNPLRIDSDEDRFADGPEVVNVAGWPAAYDLDHDGKIDGESSFGTDPADAADHPGKAGDIAPLGNPDAQLKQTDVGVLMRILANPTVIDAIPGTSQNREVAEGALDANGDGVFDAGDVITVIDESQP
jgi:hypothetical protein